jgi:hypothetical protein
LVDRVQISKRGRPQVAKQTKPTPILAIIIQTLKLTSRSNPPGPASSQVDLLGCILTTIAKNRQESTRNAANRTDRNRSKRGEMFSAAWVRYAHARATKTKIKASEERPNLRRNEQGGRAEQKVVGRRAQASTRRTAR